MTTEQQPTWTPAGTNSTKLQPQFFPVLNRTLPATKRGNVRWCGGPLVAAATLAKLESWQGPTMSAGALIDSLVNHAEKTGYEPKQP